MLSRIVRLVITRMEVGMQIASTHTLALDPAVGRRIVGVRKEVALRREVPAAVPAVETPPEPMQAPDVRAGARLRQEWMRPGVGDATEFAMFAATLAATGLLHLVLALLP